MSKTLILVRGISGSGKSTFAATLGCPVYSADDYFMVDGVYRFNPMKLEFAHNHCKNSVLHAMYGGADKIAVANTFTQAWEMEDYLWMAKAYDYTVFTIIVENRHGGANIHDVPDETVEKQRQRFEVML